MKLIRSCIIIIILKEVFFFELDELCTVAFLVYEREQTVLKRQGGHRAGSPAARSVGALCHLLMSSLGGSKSNPSLSRGVEIRPCPVAKGFNSLERCQCVITLHYTQTIHRLILVGIGCCKRRVEP